jgi:hypothetical protein
MKYRQFPSLTFHGSIPSISTALPTWERRSVLLRNGNMHMSTRITPPKTVSEIGIVLSAYGTQLSIFNNLTALFCILNA